MNSNFYFDSIIFVLTILTIVLSVIFILNLKNKHLEKFQDSSKATNLFTQYINEYIKMLEREIGEIYSKDKKSESEKNIITLQNLQNNKKLMLEKPSAKIGKDYYYLAINDGFLKVNSIINYKSIANPDAVNTSNFFMRVLEVKNIDALKKLLMTNQYFNLNSLTKKKIDKMIFPFYYISPFNTPGFCVEIVTNENDYDIVIERINNKLSQQFREVRNDYC